MSGNCVCPFAKGECSADEEHKCALEHGVDVLLGLDKVHLDIIDGLIPFYGRTREEVIKFIIINWMKKKYLNKRLD